MLLRSWCEQRHSATDSREESQGNRNSTAKATYDNISFENHDKSNGEIPVEPSYPVKADIVSKTTQEPNEYEIDNL